MIKAHFIIRDNKAVFILKGHSDFADKGSDIVCSAVSSACYMAANTITEILGVNAKTETDDGYMRFSVSGSGAAADIIKGLKLHLEAISREYPEFVSVATEV